jgi:hypothetical protein
MVDGVGDACRVPSLRQGSLEVQDKVERAIARKLARPAHDEFLGVTVEVLLVERGGVEGVEELRYLA